MREILFLLLLLGSLFSNSQTKQVKGVLLNELDSLPIAYANIYNNKYKFGTISNELGNYILNYPDSINNFNITISSIGYLSKTISKTNIPDTLYLKESVVQLDEVVLVNTNSNISFVLKKVYNNIKKNYSNKRHLLKAFYRQSAISIKDSSYLRVVEADIGLQEYGILKALDRDRIKIYQYRKSDDKITKKWYMKVAEKITGGIPNYLFWIKKTDFIKNFVKYKDYHSHYNNILKNYYFEFSEYKMINGDLVGVYNYYRKKYKVSKLKDSYKSKLYINLNDYAIIKVKNVSIYGPANSYTASSPNEYTYTKIGGYYYLNNAINRRYQSGRGTSKEILIDQLYVYQVEIDRKNYQKIKRKEKEKDVGDIYNKTIKNDTLFWNNYKFLPVVPLKDKLKTLIEKDKSLKTQFLDNGKTK